MKRSSAAAVAFALVLHGGVSLAQTDPGEARRITSTFPGWFLADPAYVPDEIKIFKIADQDELRELCARSTPLTMPGGCTNRGMSYESDEKDGQLKRRLICRVYIGPLIPPHFLNCALRHELKHCMGWNHVHENSECS